MELRHRERRGGESPVLFFVGGEQVVGSPLQAGQGYVGGEGAFLRRDTRPDESCFYLPVQSQKPGGRVHPYPENPPRPAEMSHLAEGQAERLFADMAQRRVYVPLLLRLDVPDEPEGEV